MAKASSSRGDPEYKALEDTRPAGVREASPLERDVPLSQSLIWRRQREFYAQRGLKAWSEDRVPEYITNNPFITEIYARIVAEFLDECLAASGMQTPSVQHPLRILELGAGSGKFSYLFLRHLREVLRGKNIPLSTVRYGMTDCSESIVAAWRGNSYLAEFVVDGLLDFAVYQAGEASEAGKAGEANERPAAGGKSNPDPFPSGAGPLVVIANYVFDSLPQDAFVVASKEGQSRIL